MAHLNFLLSLRSLAKALRWVHVFSALLVVLLMFGLTACNTEDYRTTIGEKQAITEQRVEEARTPAAPHRYNPLTVTDSVWTGAKAVRMRHGLPLPDRFEGNRSVAIISSTPMSLHAVAAAISTQTGMTIRFSKDTDEGEDEPSGSSASTGSSSSKSLSASKSSGTTKSSAASESPALKNGIRLAYEGPLSGLLERVSSHFGVSWKYDGSSINLAKYETRVFVMDVLAGTQKVKDGLKEDTSNQASSSGSAQVTTVSQQSAEQSSSMDIDFKFWEEVGKTIETIMGGVGTYALSPSTGTITIVTTPEIMHTVADYIDQENQRLSRQVAINVEVYTIDITEGEDFNTKFSALLHGRGIPGFDVASGGSPATTTTSGLGSITTSILSLDKKLGLNDMFSLLSQVGKTARVAEFPLTTLNNRPVSRRIGRDQAYLASVQTNTSQTFQNTTLTPGIIRDGFSIQLTPRILGDGRVLLQYSLSLTDILTIAQFNSGTNSIQLPTTATRIFVQQTILRSGSTLVLAGFDEDQVQQNSSGVGNAYNYLLGGGVANSKTRQVLFIAMTPQEITLPRTENE